MNTIEYKVYGRYALFTDPITRIGGEKSTYLTPTYEAIKGVTKSIYWKPSIIWYIDKIRVMKRFSTQCKGIKNLRYQSNESSLSFYSYLVDVEYQVQAHFEFNPYHKELFDDHIPAKHLDIANRAISRGGRQDIFLGTRECQGYVEPCSFGTGTGDYDNYGSLSLGMMFHGFDYPDEIGKEELWARLWNQEMNDGIITFKRPDDCSIKRFIRKMYPKQFATKNPNYVEDYCI